MKGKCPECGRELKGSEIGHGICDRCRKAVTFLWKFLGGR